LLILLQPVKPKQLYQIGSAAAAVDKIGGRVVILRVVVGGDGARVVGREVGVVRATTARLLGQDLDQLSQEVVRLQKPNLEKKFKTWIK
jgi:hypothetical protein